MKTILALALASVACTGGAGTIVDPPDSERSTSTIEGSNESNEPPSATNENTARSNEPPAGAARPATPTTFACTGKFLCRTTGDDDTDNVTLSEKDGVCTADDFVLRSDQQVLQKGAALGTWSFANDTITVVAGASTTTCTKTAD